MSKSSSYSRKLRAGVAVGALAIAVVVPKVFAGSHHGHGGSDDDEGRGIRHVLLISVDGMHAIDFTNCANGIAGVNGGAPYCSNLAALAHTGVNYLDTTTAKPSDSFPGLMAIVSGGSPRTVGAFYDVAYDRSLQPPATMTGNGLLGGTCSPGQVPTGTTTEYEEGVDLDQSKLNGGEAVGDGDANAIDPAKLPRDPAHGCAPVQPYNFVRTNTVFGVIHKAGGTRRGPINIRSMWRSQDLAMGQTSTIFMDRRSTPTPQTLWRFRRWTSSLAARCPTLQP